MSRSEGLKRYFLPTRHDRLLMLALDIRIPARIVDKGDLFRFGKTPEGAHRFFKPIEEAKALERIALPDRTYSQPDPSEIDQDEIYPRFDTDYEGSNTEALRQAVARALMRLNLRTNFDQSVLILSGLATGDQISEPFSSWDLPVNLKGEVPIDKLYEVRRDR